jgi:hypothetical protein
VIQGRNMIAAALGCVAIGFCIFPAAAHKGLLDRARALYALKKEIGKCQFCHDLDESKKEEPESSNLDEYGKDVDNLPTMKPILEFEDEHVYTKAEAKVIDDALKSLENADSDKDGATNIEEIELGTFPGKKASVPEKAALEEYRKKKR